MSAKLNLPNNNPIIKINNLHKSFANKKVLHGLNLQVYKQEVVAFLGINGAGKTTTFNCLLGLEQPTSGSVTIMGKSPLAATTRQHIGNTPQHCDFPPRLTVAEIIDFVGNHYPNRYSSTVIMQQFALSHLAHSRLAGLSGGEKRRVAVALAFVGRPTIVFLDEPTTGLDVESRRQVWQGVGEYINQGGSVLLTTHYIEEAEALPSRVAILKDGRIVSDGSVTDIIANHPTTQVTFTYDGQLPVNIPHVTAYKQQGEQWLLHSDDSDNLIKFLVQHDIAFSRLTVKPPTLEHAFLQLSGEQQ